MSAGGPPPREGEASRRQGAAGRGGVPDGVLVGILLVLLGTVAMVWLAAGLSALIAHGHWPRLAWVDTPEAIRRLVSDPGHPASAWDSGGGSSPAGRGLAGPWGFWGTLAVLLLALLALARVVWRIRLRLTRGRRPATRDTGSASAPAGPETTPQRPAPIGYGTTMSHDDDGDATVPGPRAAEGRRDDDAASVGRAPTAALVLRHLSAHAVLERYDTIRPATAAAVRRGTGARRLSLVVGPTEETTAANPRDVLQCAISLGNEATTLTPLYGGLDLNYCVVGPPRSGKGTHVLHGAIAHAPGPVLAVAGRPDAFRATWMARQKLGPVWLYDPAGLCGDVPPSVPRVRWEPQWGCEERRAAAARAAAMLAPWPVEPDGTSAARRRDRAESILRGLLHAAALGGGGSEALFGWCAWTVERPETSPAAAEAPHPAVEILRTDPGAHTGAASELDAALSVDDHLGGGALDMLRDSLRAVSSPSDTDVRLSVGSILRQGGTLYVTSPPCELSHRRPTSDVCLATALVDDVVEHGRQAAHQAPAGRLDPPMLCVLDDSATVAPAPRLPEYMVDAGGLGLPTITVLRDSRQARERWGERAGELVWTAPEVRIALGPEDAGELREELRTRPFGTAVVLHRDLPPLLSTLAPYA